MESKYTADELVERILVLSLGGESEETKSSDVSGRQRTLREYYGSFFTQYNPFELPVRLWKLAELNEINLAEYVEVISEDRWELCVKSFVENAPSPLLCRFLGIFDSFQTTMNIRRGRYWIRQRMLKEWLADFKAGKDVVVCLTGYGRNSIFLHKVDDFYPFYKGQIQRMAEDERRADRIVAMAAGDLDWTNEHLLKDTGLIPYLMSIMSGYTPYMVGIDNSPYPYRNLYMPEMKLEFLPDGSFESKSGYIRAHGKEIAILVVNGVYPVNQDVVKVFREVNPDGLIYMGLDANAAWMDRTDFTNDGFIKMMDEVDVIGCSDRTLQQHLNRKWPWQIEHFPNGYYHPDVEVTEASFGEKENIILTVGRLGTDQKATDIMLEAFALAAGSIPDWKLHLIGSIEEGFRSVIDDYYHRYPHLKDRVIFTGKITDKVELYQEYRNAKIFALTSRWEGAPNVVAEALHGGCAMAVTKFDAWRETINDFSGTERVGLAVAVDDTAAVAEMFISMASDQTRLRQMCHDAFVYAETNYDMKKIVARIYESLICKRNNRG